MPPRKTTAGTSRAGWKAVNSRICSRKRDGADGAPLDRRSQMATIKGMQAIAPAIPTGFAVRGRPMVIRSTATPFD